LLRRPLQDYSRLTFVLLKPDAFVAGAAGRVLAALRDRGFVARGSLLVRFNRFMIRELWRYEFNIARVERYPLIDELLCAGPSVMTVLEDRSGAIDAAARLSMLKGHSCLARRANDSLRSAIGAREGTLNFIHAPDEFIDVIREAGVLLDAAQRVELAALLDGANAGDAVSLLAEVGANYPRHSLLLADVIGQYGEPLAREVALHRETLAQDPYAVKTHFVKTLGLGQWDWITLAANYLRFSHQGVPPVFEFETVE
jgi:nucleoside diphosphate kinase